MLHVMLNCLGEVEEAVLDGFVRIYMRYRMPNTCKVLKDTLKNKTSSQKMHLLLLVVVVKFSTASKSTTNSSTAGS